jgi:hypothetical protein
VAAPTLTHYCHSRKKTPVYRTGPVFGAIEQARRLAPAGRARCVRVDSPVAITDIRGFAFF